MCKFPGCSRHPQPNGYCIFHKQYASFQPVKIPKKKNRVADKRKEVNKQYKKIVSEMAAKSTVCEIKSPGCTGTMEGLHHIVKRSPETMLDKSNLLRACNACNRYIESHPKWALENLVSKSKFSKKKSVIVAEIDRDVNAIIIQ